MDTKFASETLSIIIAIIKVQHFFTVMQHLLMFEKICLFPSFRIVLDRENVQILILTCTYKALKAQMHRNVAELIVKKQTNKKERERKTKQTQNILNLINPDFLIVSCFNHNYFDDCSQFVYVMEDESLNRPMSF